MKQPLHLAFALLLLTVFAAAGWHTFHSREPKYQGKKLTGWLRELEAAPDMASPKWQESVPAIRAIGTNGLPTLATMLGGADVRWKVQAATLIQDTANVDLSESLSNADQRPALIGFQVLGRTASPAIPKLAELAETSDPARGGRPMRPIEWLSRPVDQAFHPAQLEMDDPAPGSVRFVRCNTHKS